MSEVGNYWTGIYEKRCSRRQFIRVVAGMGVGYAMALSIACSSQTARPAAESATKSPKYGGILRWFNPSNFADLDPYDIGGRLAQRATVGIIYEWLVDLDWSGDLTRGDFKIVPRLAESWTMPDETTYVFKLRPGIKWTDGTDFTSADVKFSFDFNLDPQNTLPGRSILAPVSKIETPDKDTVKVVLKSPSAAFLSLLTDDALLIAPKHLLEKDRKGLTMKPVGTGPFVLEKVDTKSGISLKKNPNYWVKGKPYLDGMTIALIDDWSARAAAFMAKEIDLHIVPDKREYEPIKAVVPDLQLRPWANVNHHSFMFNHSRPPFNDLRVRRAVLLGIDHQGMMDRLWDGEAAVGPPVIPASWKQWAIPQDELLKMPGFLQPKTQDIAEAKRLLAEAGYPNGLKFVGMVNSEGGVAIKKLQVLAEQLKAASITMELELVERPMEMKRRKSGEFDVDFFPYGGYTEDPDRRLFSFVRSNGAENGGKLSDAKLDEMIDRQSRLLNEQERRKAMQDIQRYMIEQAYYPATPDPFYYGIMQSYVRGYDPAYVGAAYPHLRSEAGDVWLDK